MYHNDVQSEDELPDWVRNEKEQFIAYRDKDGDGFLDMDEVLFYREINF